MTTFVLPSELYPVSVRATGHGISAGIGKFGAFIGVFLFPVLQTSLGLRGTLALTACIAAIGAALTMVLPEPSGRTLEEISHHGPATPTRSRPTPRPEAWVPRPSGRGTPTPGSLTEPGDVGDQRGVGEAGHPVGELASHGGVVIQADRLDRGHPVLPQAGLRQRGEFGRQQLRLGQERCRAGRPA